MFGTQVGEAPKFSSKDLEQLQGLLDLYINNEKNQTKVGLAKALQNAIK